MRDGRAVRGVALAALDERVPVELLADGGAHRSGAAAVDDADARQAGERGVVDERADRLARLLRPLPTHVELVRDVPARRGEDTHGRVRFVGLRLRGAPTAEAARAAPAAGAPPGRRPRPRRPRSRRSSRARRASVPRPGPRPRADRSAAEARRRPGSPARRVRRARRQRRGGGRAPAPPEPTASTPGRAGGRRGSPPAGPRALRAPLPAHGMPRRRHARAPRPPRP